ncbi:Kae1-like domain-containing protein [Ferrimonas marina]|uniref:Carbamoyltransferase Kae1-like domain-containing protein n=1 Tax=Ferrimonas marina TaxID=299255 RepID=A0A1M5VFZ9_9GAMM|nr:hypothetical protein [Ferrimonas marina]SHH74169.1 hypothetical protein SAMN02745129_2761 [Ferrimonas marina]
MKLRFNFNTAQQVPIYARLCNQFLQHPLVMTIAETERGYALEAEGDEAQLSQLAELIGNAFPVSCWLIDSGIEAIDQFDGDALALNEGKLDLPYCRHCQDQPLQGCRHCDSSSDDHWLQGENSLERWVQRHLDGLLLEGHTLLETRHGRRELRLLAHSGIEDDTLLFCQPKALAESLHIGRVGQLCLSGLEKPQLRLAPRQAFIEQHQLARALYQVQLADDRLTLALTERLAQHGVVAVAMRSQGRALQLSHCDTLPIALSLPGFRHQLTHPPLHQDARMGGIHAHWDGERVQLSPTTLPDSGDCLPAACALEGIRQLDRVPKRSAVLFLSENQASGLLYRDGNEYRWLVSLDRQWQTPAAWLASVAELGSSAQRMLERVKTHHPQWLEQLDQQPGQLSGSVRDAMAMAAWLIGLSQDSDPQRAADALVAAALQHGSPVAPRIDAKLKPGPDGLQLDWRPAFQSLLCYRLADGESSSALAYGFVDSLTDFLSQWVEQLDADYGLEQVILAGDEFANPVLLDRLYRRLDRNVQIRLPAPLDFAGASLALGALFVARAEPAVA